MRVKLAKALLLEFILSVDKSICFYFRLLDSTVFLKMNKLSSVLLVDDDEATNFINKLLIQKSDLTEELVITRNGHEAVAFLEKRKVENVTNPGAMPKLILLDINMPVMDGFEFLEAFKTLDLPQKKEIVIAVLTTSLNPKDLEKVKSFGITDFLNKPLSKTTLQNLVRKHYS